MRATSRASTLPAILTPPAFVPARRRGGRPQGRSPVLSWHRELRARRLFRLLLFREAAGVLRDPENNDDQLQPDSRHQDAEEEDHG